MKLYKILFESFVHEPRDMNLFVTNLSKEIKKREKMITDLSNRFEFQSDENLDKEDKEYYFAKIIGMATNYQYNVSDIFYALRSLKHSIMPYGEHLSDKINHLFDLAKTSKNSYDKYKMLGYIVQALNIFIEDIEKYVDQYAAIKDADYSEGLENYGEYFKGNITEPLKQLAKEYIDFHKYLKEYILPKLDRLMQRSNAGTDKDMAQKTIEPVETLYHATVNAVELFRTGFKTDYKHSVEGIGGSNLDNAGNPAVSFTSDLYVAKEVARCLKEAIMIAKGQLDIYDLKTMALQSGAAQEIEKSFPEFSNEKTLEN